jgi:N-acyl-D-aspartate/D-glutamate deacylase
MARSDRGAATIVIHAARLRGERPQAFGTDDHVLEPGAPANLVVHQYETVREVLTHHEPPPAVIHGGRIVSHGEHE